MNEIQEYSFGEKCIRTVADDNGEPWFVAKDICEILELSDVSMSLSRLEASEKLIQTLFVSGQRRRVSCVSESGLYALIFSSRKPEARAFRVWVTGEVLPAIRKYGEYKADMKKVRDKSKKVRFDFTDMLKAHGCTKQGHYIQITKSMKENLGIESGKKKEKYDKTEILKTSAAEMLAAANIMQDNPDNYRECKEITDEASAAIENATHRRIAS